MSLNAFELGLFLQLENDFFQQTTWNLEHSSLHIRVMNQEDVNMGIDMRYMSVYPFKTLQFTYDEVPTWSMETSTEFQEFCLTFIHQENLTNDNIDNQFHRYLNQYIMTSAPLDSLPNHNFTGRSLKSIQF